MKSSERPANNGRLFQRSSGRQPVHSSRRGKKALVASFASFFALCCAFQGCVANRKAEHRAERSKQTIADTPFAPPDAAPANEKLHASLKGANAIVFLVDSLRADRLTPEIMPKLTARARQGALFLQAVAPFPVTPPSVASLFTGLFPTAHGLLGTLDSTDDPSLVALSGEFTTLAEAFKTAGYRTGAFVTNEWISPELGFDQGFDRFELREASTRAEILHAQALDWIGEGDGGSPFFLYLHYMDAHGPYRPPDGYPQRFAGRYGAVRELKREEFRFLTDIHFEFGPFENRNARNLNAYKEAYDGAAAYLDERIDAFIARVLATPRGRDTLFVFLSDHGEQFFEHGFPGHGNTLYEEEIRVPLFMIAPGIIPPGRRIEPPVETTALFRSLADLTGLSAPEYRVSGPSLADAALGGDPPAAQETLSMCYDDWTLRNPEPKPFMRYALRMPEGGKLIFEDRPTPILQWFDLKNDPGEKQNRIKDPARDPHVELARLQTLLADIAETGVAGARKEKKTLDPETLERLRSIGYLQ